MAKERNPKKFPPEDPELVKLNDWKNREIEKLPRSAREKRIAIINEFEKKRAAIIGGASGTGVKPSGKKGKATEPA